MRIASNGRGGFTIHAPGRGPIEVLPKPQAIKKAEKLAKGTAEEVLARLNATNPFRVVK